MASPLLTTLSYIRDKKTSQAYMALELIMQLLIFAWFLLPWMSVCMQERGGGQAAGEGRTPVQEHQLWWLHHCLHHLNHDGKRAPAPAGGAKGNVL